tara:strand:+ start:928 stop:1134 length:207 start_codon:yes stop_codon:yes gene_type:complete
MAFALSRTPYLGFQSARPVRDATDHSKSIASLTVVSIRAPREGRDEQEIAALSETIVSIRAPREGRDS